MQEKLNKANINRSRKLFDRHIKRLGTENRVVRIKMDKTSIRGDYEQIPISADFILMYLEFPPEMPLLRSRTSMVDQADPTQVSFWDLLPIFGYVRWSDNITEGDLLVHTFFDENGRKVPIVLKVTNEVGSFNTYLNWRKLVLSFYNSQLEDGVMEKIQVFLDEAQA